jgi:hypothetical protein
MRVLKPGFRINHLRSNPICSETKLNRLENVLYADARFYKPAQLRKKAEEYDLKVISPDSSSSGYFLIATKETDRKNMS